MPSYSPVFSQGFIYYTPSTPNTSFEVPAGFTAVVRQILVTSGVAIIAFNVQVQLSAEAPAVDIVADELTGVNVTYSRETRVVCPGGGFITFNEITVGTNCNAYVGGYLLRNTLT